MSERLVIIDGKSVFYRGYYAMPNLSMKDGTPTGGVYGFAVMALEVVKKLKPEYVCVAWDKRHTNIRKRLEMYSQYKANRKPAPPDFYEQVELLYELLKALNWPLYEADDYEADDLMATFARQAGEKGIESYLVTSDLDVLQCVNEHTHIYTLKKGLSNIELFNVASFQDKYGVGAHQWVDVKALKGDASDNIPGVAGIGEKTALELIKQYDTLDGVYENIELIKNSLKAKLVKDKDMAYLSKKLVTLMTDAPVKLDFEHARLHDGVSPEFVALLRKFEFRVLLRQAEAAMNKADMQAAEVESTGKELPPIKLKAYHEADYVASKPRVVAMNTEGTELWISPVSGYYSVVPLDTVAKELSALSNGPLIGHDLKRILRTLLALNITWPGPIGHDTRIGAFILNSLLRSRELSDLLERPITLTDPEQVLSATWVVYDEQRQQFAADSKLQEVATGIDFPTIQLLATVEQRGITLDVNNLRSMSDKFAIRINEFEHKIYELAGKQFNISSPTQLGSILFDTLGMPTQGVKKGKTGYSTGAAELDKLRSLHPIVDLITQYREYTKLKSTYLDALPNFIDEHSKVHTTYDLDVAATGRLSSRDPNLQNIPTRTDIGQAIRRAFVPGKGNVFVSADYNQFELRLAAVLADDHELIDSFNKHEDIHTKTAAQIYGIPMEQVTKNQRRDAKVVNFGIMYGMSPHGLSIATGMTFVDAKEFIRKYFELRAPLRAYIDNTVKQAEHQGYVETLFGRRRPTPDLKSSNFAIREAAKRAAMNMPIQGTEADLMKLAMLNVEREIAGLGEQLLQIHDSILVETPKANADKVAGILKSTMESVHPLPVALKVDVTTGNSWGDL
jgi:DNA polymerase I